MIERLERLLCYLESGYSYGTIGVKGRGSLVIGGGLSRTWWSDNKDLTSRYTPFGLKGSLVRSGCCIGTYFALAQIIRSPRQAFL